MKISKDTINILKNFATISNNLRIYPGNELATLSPQQNIFARVTVAEQFPTDVCIYELNSFLDLLSYMENQDVEFGEKSLTITNNGSTFEYRYADPSVIISPPAGKNIELDSFYQFTLTEADVNLISKAIGITAADHVVFEGKNGQATLTIVNDKKGMGQSKIIGQTDLTFKALLNVGTFQIIPSTYTVTLSKLKFLHFKSENAQMPQYWLALDPESKV
jgi:hypothetical protein